MCRVLCLATLFVTTPVTTAVRAADQTTCGHDNTWVRLQSDTDDGAVLRAAIAERLRADLAGQGVVVCDASDSTEGDPHATVSLQTSRDQVLVAVGFENDGKAGSAQHTVDLASIPDDGRSMAVAAIAAELLRTYAPAPVAAIDTDIEAHIDPAAETEPPKIRWAYPTDLEMGMGGTRYAGGQQQWGPDIRARYWFARRFALSASASYRFSRPQQAFNGLIDAQSLLAGLGLDFAIVPRQHRVQILASAFGAGGAITYAPRPDQEARGATVTLPVATAGGALSAAYRLTPMWFAGLRVQGVATVYSAGARDDDETVTAVSGLGGEAAFFLGANL